MKRISGFTLLELMVAISVAAILLTIGIPSFTSSIRRNQSVSDANALLGLLTLARSEAVKTDRIVTLCTSTDGKTCDSSAAWSQGYVILSGSEIVKGAAPFSTGSSITASSNVVSFNGSGNAGTVAGPTFTSGGDVFTVAPPQITTDSMRCVYVYQTGRATIIKPANTPQSCG